MQAYFYASSSKARVANAQLQHSHLPDVMFDVSLVTEDGLKLIVHLPLETDITPSVLTRCAKDSANEDCFYHPDTGEVLYLVYDGCDPEQCFTMAELIELRTPSKRLEFEEQPDKVIIF